MPVIWNEGELAKVVEWLIADGAPGDIAPDFVDGLLRYPRLQQLLEEAGCIQLRTMEPRFGAPSVPLWEFVEAPDAQ